MVRGQRDLLLIADVAHGDDDPAPHWVIDGYGTLFAELDEQLDDQPLDAMFVPAGVGALTAAAVRHVRQRRPDTRVIAVEPLGAACVLASLQRGRIVTLPNVDDSVMVGLNCGTPSAAAWPDLLGGVEGVVAVDDRRVSAARDLLAEDGLEVGPAGAASCAGLLEVMRGRTGAAARRALGLDDQARVLLLATEGSGR
jgi:diaminopropionate ammonia-lyase